MTDRSTLHLRHVDEFRAWLDSRGWVTSDGDGEFVLFRAYDGVAKRGVYRRTRAEQHASLCDVLAKQARRFYRERKAALDAALKGGG